MNSNNFIGRLNVIIKIKNNFTRITTYSTIELLETLKLMEICTDCGNGRRRHDFNEFNS